jgi:hypothetical protein
MTRSIPALLVVLALALTHPVSAGHHGTPADAGSHVAHEHGDHTACGTECEKPKIPPCCSVSHFLCAVDGVVGNASSLSTVEWAGQFQDLPAAETSTGLLPEPHIPPPRV